MFFEVQERCGEKRADVGLLSGEKSADFGLLSGKLRILSFRLESMALKKIYHCLRKVCMTSGANTKVQFNDLLSSLFLLNKPKDELCSVTSLCSLAMTCGQKTNHCKLSCVAWQMAMICGQKTDLPSCVARLS